MIMHGCFTPRVVSGFVVETIINQHLGAGTAFFMNNAGYIMLAAINEELMPIRAARWDSFRGTCP
jgi:hypothetical protein